MADNAAPPPVPASGGSAPGYDYNRVIPEQKDSRIAIERMDNVVVIRNPALKSISVSVDENRDGKLDGPEDSHLDVIGNALIRVARGACNYAGKISTTEIAFETLNAAELGSITSQLAKDCPRVQQLQRSGPAIKT